MKPGDVIRFFWMGEWHIGSLIRWAGLSVDDGESLYEVANGNLHLYYHPKHLIEPIKI